MTEKHTCYVISENRSDEFPELCDDNPFYEDTGESTLELCDNCKKLCCLVHKMGAYCLECIANPLLPDEKKPFCFKRESERDRNLEKEFK
ncbi:hypothetical protein LCGC14_0175470 [marine sediment metagenome]|uniref:Uncharacterized protein n=1 Tax=marine sediment metagenome TaxID=412755 RepID=A0A0F9XTP9_9ZZZZ